jgi:arylsulfatase A-like enzyme
MKAAVIVVGGLHTGYLGCYGSDWVATPELDRLAADGVVFDRHYSDRPDAVGARYAWQTGRYLFPMPGEPGTEPDVRDLDVFSELNRHGVATVFIKDRKMSVTADNAQGWDEVEWLIGDTESDSFLAQLRRSLETSLEHVLARQRWLLRIDLGSLLPPWPNVGSMPSYQPMSSSSSEVEDSLIELQDAYAARVSLVDCEVGAIVSELERAGIFNQALLIITANHGQALAEHRTVGAFCPSLYEEYVHLPFIVRMPGRAQAGRRIGGFTQPPDLAPTLANHLGITAPESHGQSLLPLIDGKVDSIRPYACSGLRFGDCLQWALRTPEWSFFLPVQCGVHDTPKLYVQPDDRWEVNDLYQQQFEVAEKLEKTLRAFVAATREPGPLQPPTWPGSTSPSDTTTSL